MFSADVMLEQDPKHNAPLYLRLVFDSPLPVHDWLANIHVEADFVKTTIPWLKVLIYLLSNLGHWEVEADTEASVLHQHATDRQKHFVGFIGDGTEVSKQALDRIYECRVSTQAIIELDADHMHQRLVAYAIRVTVAVIRVCAPFHG